MTVLPGPIRQIGYVVTDLDRAMARWLELGVGPWFVLRGLPMHASYRGEPCETTLSLAWSNSGEMQIELIQQQDDTPASSPNSSRPRPGLSDRHSISADATDRPCSRVGLREQPISRCAQSRIGGLASTYAGSGRVDAVDLSTRCEPPGKRRCGSADSRDTRDRDQILLSADGAREYSST